MPNRPQELPYLDVSATYDPGTREVDVNVLNRSRDRDLTTSIESASGAWESAAQVWQMTDADLKATNSFTDPQRVRPTTSTATLEGTGGGVRYTFPAHSLTILTLKLRP